MYLEQTTINKQFSLDFIHLDCIV